MATILLVEDDEALAMGIEYSLKNENFNVFVGNTIKESKKIFMENSIDLILLDVTLPDGNGYDLCKHIREKSQVPIIFLTACDDEVNIVLGLDMGGDDYITKPFRLREMISRIKAVMRRKNTVIQEKVVEENTSILQSNGMEIHVLKAQVFKGDKEIFLTPAEYKLLCLFIQNPNITLKREVILEKLWDSSGEFVDDNTLSVYIKRLREKIEDKSSSPKRIVTVRGIGYKWNDNVEA
ncbi:response regulator transcription factor [Haloimpatiens massiliensis]|uniref:response regulator transcription factor n=1 Tax=Haloimpatiens massiliensis TaxID=1658110 RepID=UPI000C857300|nr:response regulator transcription factor [Haloimpatiens massiliensis]